MKYIDTDMINFTISSPQKTTVYENVLSITLPAFSGQMQILPGHAESFILVQKGTISVRQLHKESNISQTQNAECHVKNDVVTIIL